MDIPVEKLFTIDMINKTEIFTMKVQFLYIPKYLVTNFLLMHEKDKMWKMENNKIQSHTIHKITQIFSLGNPYMRKLGYNMRLVCSLFFGMEIMQVQRRRHSLWSYPIPMACQDAIQHQRPLLCSLISHSQLLFYTMEQNTIT
jgi:hypothetical protein